jgi:lipopolysaccharide transport system ATP-binding protein
VTRQPFGIAPYSAFDRCCDTLAMVKQQVGITKVPEVRTLMHVTHPKAGSTWISNLLERLFGDRCAPRGTTVAKDGDLEKHVFEPGRVYRAMFLPRDAFFGHPELRDIQRFVVIRDLRDTLVSLYFSIKVSHPTRGKTINLNRLAQLREVLQEMPEEEGLIYLIDNAFHVPAIQRSWVNRGEILVRYEDMLLDPILSFRKLFREHLCLGLSQTAIDRAVRCTHFQSVYGRKLGEEDVASHGRQALPGDWRNHFAPAVKRRFAEKYADLLIDTGYEQDGRWAKEA